MVIEERRSIVIVGAGQLGSRYLQGLVRCSHRLRIQVVDPAPEALTTAADRWTTSVAQHGILIRALLARWREVSGPDAECVPIT